MVEVVVPVAFFVAVFGIIAVVVYFRFRSQQELQETVRTLLQSGQPVSEEKLSELVAALSPREQDLRRALISIAIAIAIALFAFMLDERDAFGPLMGLAAFPLLIGFAYLFLHQNGQKKQLD